MFAKAPFLILIFLSALYPKVSATFETRSCTSLSKQGVLEWIASAIGGGTEAQDIADRLVIADFMSERSFSKTWATNLSLQEYFALGFDNTIVKANKHRFSYDAGEASGGYRLVQPISTEPFRTWEINAREVMGWTYDYMLQLSEQIDGFNDLFPVRPTLDRGCDQRFHATHAELKLLTRLMRKETIDENDSVIMAVSRHMCSYCQPIVQHLARNGGRSITVVAPRKSTKGARTAIEQPEYIYFGPDGSMRKYTRMSPAADSTYSCRETSFTDVPAGLDTYHPPDPNFEPTARQIAMQVGTQIRALNRTNILSRQEDNDEEEEDEVTEDVIEAIQELLCEDETEGPENTCITYSGDSFPTQVGCPRGQTVTGIHGTFGDSENRSGIAVLQSIGLFCDVSTVVNALGTESDYPFELKCPTNYQLTGFHSVYNQPLNTIGITCRKISDWAKWESERFEVTTLPREIFDENLECEFGAAGRAVRVEFDQAQGIGLCCR